MGKHKYWKKTEDSQYTESWENELTFTKVTMSRSENGYEVMLLQPRFHDDGSISRRRLQPDAFSNKSDAREQAMFYLEHDPEILLEDIETESFGEAVQGLFADDAQLREHVLERAVEQIDGITLEAHNGMPVSYDADYNGRGHNYSLFLTHPQERNPIAKENVSWYEVNQINLDLIVHDAAVEYFEMHEDDPLWLLSVTGLAVRLVDSDLGRNNLPKAPRPILQDIAGMAGTKLATRYKNKIEG